MNDHFPETNNTPVMRIRSDFADELCAGDLLIAAHELLDPSKPYKQPRFIGFYISKQKQYLTDGILNAEITPCGLIEDLARRLKRLKIWFNLDVKIDSTGLDRGQMVLYDRTNGDCYLVTVREAVGQLQYLNKRRPSAR